MKKINFASAMKVIALIFAYLFNVAYAFTCITIIPVFFFLEDTIDVSDNFNIPACCILILPILFFIFSTLWMGNKDKTLKFFFGLEVPILLLSLTRICLLREMTPFYWVLLSGLLISIIFFALNLFDFKIENTKFKKISLIAFETPVIIGAYFALLSIFIIIPIGAKLLQVLLKTNYIVFFQNIFNHLVFNSFNILHFFEFIYYSCIVLFFMSLPIVLLITPIVSTVIYIKEFIKKFREEKDTKLCFAWAFVYILLFYLSSFHFSDINISNKYEAIKKAQNYEETYELAKTILPKQSLIKNAITDNYLAKLRYISDKDSNTIYDLYMFACYSEDISSFAQKLFNEIAYPFNYRHSFHSKNADEQYKIFFDEDIQKGENKTITNSVNSTYFTKQTSASLLDIDSKDVQILNRTINAEKTQTPNIYKVTITEEYVNKKKQDKEVYYEFSLPENAAITNLWLGHNLQYKGEISAKGAARKTYEAQVQRKTDPALLEKNGVRQYTLRVYPVNPYRDNNDIQKVRYEYYTELDNGSIALPVIYQTRNAYFGVLSNVKITLNDKIIKLDKDASKINIQNQEQNNFKLPDNKNIAILLDTSYSNKINWESYLSKEVPEIKAKQNIDYYLFNKFLSKKIESIDKINQINFAQTAKLDAYCAIPKEYDAVIMLTDTSVFDASINTNCQNNMPLYVVHTDEKNSGKIPPYNVAFTNLIYKTKGYIFTDVKDALSKLSETINENEQNPNDENLPELRAINAIKEINSIMRNENPDDIQTKEKIHSIAKKEGVVSNYSSYIALINNSQKEQLKDNEKAKDKFDADLKTGEDIGLKVKNITAVPEPQDWIYLTLLLVTILIIAIKTKCTYSKP